MCDTSERRQMTAEEAAAACRAAGRDDIVEVPPKECPACHATLCGIRRSSRGWDDGPRRTICMACGVALNMADDFSLTQLTEEEEAALPALALQELADVRAWIAQRRPGEPDDADTLTMRLRALFEGTPPIAVREIDGIPVLRIAIPVPLTGEEEES